MMQNYFIRKKENKLSLFFAKTLFYMGFLSRTFTIRKTLGEWESYFGNTSLPLLPG